MGGRDGARGYLYQAIVAVIDSLSDLNWEKVTLEPATNDEKIDVLWEYPHEAIKVTQVKSTNGSMGRGKILEVLNLMIKDEPMAENYELVIVGQITKDASVLKQQFDQGIFSTNDPAYNDFQDYLNRIKIRVEDFSIQSLESTIYRHIDKLLFANNPSIINPEIKEVHVKAIIYQFLSYSTVGQTLSRETLNKLLTLKGESDWRNIDIGSLLQYTVYLLDRYHDATIDEKMQIIKMFGRVEEVFYDRDDEPCDLYALAMIFKNNHLSLSKDIFLINLEEGEDFLEGLGTESIYITSVNVLLKIIACLLEFLSPSYRHKGNHNGMLMKEINDIDKEAIVRFDNQYTKREFMIVTIKRYNIFSYYDGSWKNKPVCEVW